MTMVDLPPEIAAVIIARDGRGALLVFDGDGLVRLDVGPGELALVGIDFAQKALAAAELQGGDHPKFGQKPNGALWAAITAAARSA